MNREHMDGVRTARRRDRLGHLLLRLSFRALYAVTLLAGTAAARLAALFRALGDDGRLRPPIRLLLQIPVFACWLVVRPIALASYACCALLAPRL